MQDRAACEPGMASTSGCWQATARQSAARVSRRAGQQPDRAGGLSRVKKWVGQHSCALQREVIANGFDLGVVAHHQNRRTPVLELGVELVPLRIRQAKVLM